MKNNASKQKMCATKVAQWNKNKKIIIIIIMMTTKKSEQSNTKKALEENKIVHQIQALGPTMMLCVGDSRSLARSLAFANFSVVEANSADLTNLVKESDSTSVNKVS